MAKTVGLVELPKELSNIIAHYTDDLKESLDKVLASNANDLVEEIKTYKEVYSQNREQTHLINSFTATRIQKGKHAGSFKIWSPKKYMIVHLVEFGHWYWENPSIFVEPNPFFISSYEKIAKKMYEEMIQTVKGGK